MSFLRQNAMYRIGSAVIGFGFLAAVLSPIRAQDTASTVTLPELTGEYAVGYTAYTLVDDSRQEIFTEDQSDVRTIPLIVYYPAAPAPDAVPSPYASEEEVKTFNKVLGIPESIFNSLQSHTYAAAPAAKYDAGFPVLMFSPGFGTPVKFYTALLEEIVSHGYVVAVVDHPYSQSVSLFADGSSVTANAAGSDLSTDESRNGILNVWVGDTIFALTQLEQLNADDPLLAGTLDLSRVGAFGHSFGGATAAEVSIADERILAAINMDGSMFGQAAQGGVVRPFMMMMSDSQDMSDAELKAAGMTRAQADDALKTYEDSIQAAVGASEAGYTFKLLGSRHNTYTSEMPLLRTLLPMFITDTEVGTIDGVRANEVISTYIRAFFDHYVRGDALSPLLNGNTADYPDVVLQPAS